MAKTIYDLIDEEFGVNTRPVIHVESVDSTAELLLKNDPTRLAFILFNLGANDGHINITSEVSATNGLVVPGSGGSLSMNWKEDFHLPAVEWWAFQITAAANWMVVEIQSV